jgi:hypothetical protein
MADSSDPTRPTWPELGLDGHVRRLRISLAGHVVILVSLWFYWEGWLGVRSDAILVLLIVALLLNDMVLGRASLKIQKTLHENGLYRHGDWLIRGLLLNPVTLGLWIPVSAALTAWRIRRMLQAR